MLVFALSALFLAGLIPLLLVPVKRARYWLRYVQPFLERLEVRLTPTTFLWTGAINANWDNANNWSIVGTPTNADTFPNSKTDEADFFAAGKNAPTVDGNFTVGTLYMKTGYTQTLTIAANQTLTVAGGGPSTLADGVIAFQQKSALNLSDIAFDSGTDIDSGGTGLGTIYVNNNGILQFVQGPTTGLKLGASLVIGVDASGTASAGTVDFAGDYNFKANTQKLPLNGPVTLYNNVKISNQAQGVINFNQGSNSATNGGIALDKSSMPGPPPPAPPNPGSTIVSFGTINRNVPDTQDVTVAAPVTTGAGSTLNVGDNSGINFLKSYKFNGSHFNLSPKGGRIKGFIANTGAINITDPGSSGTFVAYVEDNLILNGATLSYNVTTPGATVTLAVAGDADITGGSISVPTGASLTVAGQVNLSGGAVDAYGGVSVAAAYNQTGGTVTVGEYGGALTVGGATTLSGGTLQVNGGTVASVGVVAVGGGTLQLAGTLTAPTVQVIAGGLLTGSGTITGALANAGEVDVPDGGVLSVGAAYTQTAGVTRVGVSSSNGTLAVSGVVAEQGGTIVLTNATLQAGGGLQIGSGAAFTGYGTVTGDVTNSGSLTVGGGYYASLRVNGNYMQTGGGALTLDLNSGSDPDTLRVSGQASLDGAFTLDSVDGRTPSVGTWLWLVYYGSRTGQFATLNLPALSGGVWDPVYNDASGSFMLEVNAS